MNIKFKYSMVCAIIVVLLTCALLTLVIASLFGNNSKAYADRLLVNEISNNEIKLANNNLYCKFENGNYPKFLNVKLLRDFSGESLYALYLYDNYYSIVIRNTGTILERGDGPSLFDGMQGELYYGGFNKAYQRVGDNIYDENWNIISSSEQLSMSDYMMGLRSADYQDYLESQRGVVIMGESNRDRISKLGGSSNYYNYFAQDINIYYNYHKSNGTQRIIALNSTDFVSIDRCLYSVDRFSDRNYGTAYYRSFGGKYDMYYPNNVYNSCSLVSMTMLLQYYDRNSISNLISSDISYSSTRSAIKSNPWINSKSERIMRKLYPLLYSLDGIGETFDGAATYANIDAAFGRYFNDNNINANAKCFTSYTNVKGAIDRGNPVIITIGAGRGFYKNFGSSSYETVDLSGHNVVAYGYTKNSIGVLDEFIVHANWHEWASNTAVVFVNKLYSAGNCYIDVL